MAEAHLDHPGEISWYKGYGPVLVLGPCPHACPHNAQSAIGWGPDMQRYELVQCDVLGGCETSCRAWANGHGAVATGWLLVAWADARLLEIMQRRTAEVPDHG